MSLLDVLANSCECFISDLMYQYFLSQIKLILLKFPIKAYSIQEWNQTLNYLFHQDNFTTHEEILEFLNR